MKFGNTILNPNNIVGFKTQADLNKTRIYPVFINKPDGVFFDIYFLDSEKDLLEIELDRLNRELDNYNKPQPTRIIKDDTIRVQTMTIEDILEQTKKDFAAISSEAKLKYKA